MKISKILSLGLVISLMSQVTLAEDTEVIAGSSNSTVTFKEGEEVTPPPPPIDPGPEVEPTPGTGLWFTAMIESMNFGEASITGSALDIAMEAPKGPNSGNPQVSFIGIGDTRGKAKGWKVNASISNFTKVDDEEIIIDGARVVLKAGSHRIGPDDYIGTVIKDVILDPGNTEEVIVAEQKSGSIHRFTTVVWGDDNGIDEEGRNKSIRLHIPATASLEVAEYEATITWSIEHIVGEEPE